MSGFRRLKLTGPKRDVMSAALFGRIKASRLPAPLEADILSGLYKFLRVHPRVAWVARVNSGGAQNEDGRYIRFHDIVGCSDFIGQMRTGAFLAIEVKRKGEKPTPNQRAFLELVARFGGCSGYATSIEGVQAILNEWQRGRAK